jgi:hypothetical protein
MAGGLSTTAYCLHCGRNVQVGRITAQHLKCYWWANTDQRVEVPMTANGRQVEAVGGCGHRLNFVTTLQNIEAINDRVQCERDMARELRENAMSLEMATT